MPERLNYGCYELGELVHPATWDEAVAKVAASIREFPFIGIVTGIRSNLSVCEFSTAVTGIYKLWPKR